jgi:hypothetical protein
MSKCPYQLVDETGSAFEPATHPVRSDIPEVPATMQHLPVDERGYPVPFFVQWIQQKPEFRAASAQALRLAIQHDFCWVCGTPLRGQKVFTIGPMCSVNRLSAEPPAHIACARYSVRACPFLTKPHMVRRENDLPEGIVAGAARRPKLKPIASLCRASQRHFCNPRA